MKSEKGSIVLIAVIIFILIGLLVGGLVLFMKRNSQTSKSINDALPTTNIQGKSTRREGPVIDLSKTPSNANLPDFINHCVNNPGSHWSGSNCSPN